MWAHFLFSPALANVSVKNIKNIQKQSELLFPSQCRLQLWQWQPLAPSGELLRGSLLLWEMLSRPFSHTEAWYGARNVRCEEIRKAEDVQNLGWSRCCSIAFAFDIAAHECFSIWSECTGSSAIKVMSLLAYKSVAWAWASLVMTKNQKGSWYCNMIISWINLIIPEKETYWMSLLCITEITTARYFMDLPREHELVSCLRESLEGPVKASANISIEECDGKWPGSSMFRDAYSGRSKQNRFKWDTVSLSQLQWLWYWYFWSFNPTVADWRYIHVSRVNFRTEVPWQKCLLS